MMQKLKTTNLTSRRGKVIAFALTSVLFVGATIPPFLGDTFRAFLMAAFSGVCHQMADRSFHINGHSLAVCHRCYGMYAGMWLASIVTAFQVYRMRISSRMSRILIVGALLPPGIDWFGDVVGLWTNSMPSRVITGAIFGLVAGLLLTRAMVEATTSKYQSSEAASHKGVRADRKI